MSQINNLQAKAYVMNTPIASDFTISNGILNVDGLSLDIPYEDARLLTVGDSQSNGGVRGLERSRIAQSKIFSVTFSATANTTYQFNISGVNSQTGLSDSYSVSFTSGGTTSLAEIASALVAATNGLNLSVVATGAGSPVTLTSTDASLQVSAVSNVTVAAAQTTYAPNGTPAVAIRSTVAPDSNPNLAVAGTTTVTVTTDAPHGLLPGDVVDISGATTFQFIDTRPGSNQAAAAAVSDVVIATAPTSTTFTLQGVQGNGGTNGGTLVIRTKNVVTVETLAAHGLLPGNAVSVSGVATMTVNGGADFTSIVRSVPATDEMVLFGVPNASNNTGTITIASVPQGRKNYGADLSPLFTVTTGGLGANINTEQLNEGDTPVAAEGYTRIGIEFQSPGISAPANVQTKNTRTVYLYLNETAAGYAESMKRLGEVVRNWSFNTQLANANAGSL
jgi:hypothetical protein